MFMQSTAIVAKKLLLNDKITACVKQICVLGVICKVFFLSVFKFCALSNLLFLRAADWPTTNLKQSHCKNPL